MFFQNEKLGILYLLSYRRGTVMENQPLLTELNALIEYYSQKTGSLPCNILIGYRIYMRLMQYPSFADEVLNSALDPQKRKYKKLKIKVTKEDNQLEIE